ncbi:E3 ubiquitin-protein ligase TRIM45-like [Antedon mediterranea]|uniref:E3 ubiquitin-protein ligase TRIM45-like n=1 Tax=Antedon mediterranea TaxID=105859 RepID=UPI003AF504C5
MKMADEKETTNEMDQEQSKEKEAEEPSKKITNEDANGEVETQEDTEDRVKEHSDDRTDSESNQQKDTSNTGSSDVNDIQDCFVCKKQLNDPKTLPCVHSFCIACLKDHMEAKEEEESPVCPVCSSSIPDGNVEDLPLDPLIEIVLKCQLNDGEEKCNLCSSDATQRCTICEHFLCTRDAEQHKVIPATKDHECIEISEYKNLSINDRMALQRVNCSEHADRAAEVYCKSCDVFMCMACSVVDQQRTKHYMEAVDGYIDRLTPKLKKISDDLLKQNEASDEAVSKIKNAMESLQPKKEQASDDISKLCSDLREIIDKCEQELTEELNERFKQKSESMEAVLKQTNGNSLQAKSIIGYIDCLLGSRNCELFRHVNSSHTNSFEKTLKQTRQASKVINVTDVLAVVVDQKKVDGIVSNNLCSFKLSDVSVENSSFSRITDAKTGEIKTFTVTTRNEDDEPTVADPVPTVEIISSEKKTVATPTLESHKNGTYQYSWIPKVTGTFGVKVCFGKKQLKGSPFKINVQKGQPKSSKSATKKLPNKKGR